MQNQDSEGQLSSEEENLIAQSTSAINSLFGQRYCLKNRLNQSKLIVAHDLDDQSEIEVSLSSLGYKKQQSVSGSRRLRIFQDITQKHAGLENEQDFELYGLEE